MADQINVSFRYRSLRTKKKYERRGEKGEKSHKDFEVLSSKRVFDWMRTHYLGYGHMKASEGEWYG